jgi:phosphatase NudJ
MTTAPVPIYACVLVLVEEGGRYLLLQEAKPERGYPWCIPAGRVEPGESIVEAAKRETLEETGLVIEPQQLLQVKHVIPLGQDKQNPSPELWHFILVAVAKGGQLKSAGDEHSMQAGWFRPEQLKSLNLRADYILELIELHGQGRPSLPIDAYGSRVAHVYPEWPPRNRRRGGEADGGDPVGGGGEVR